MQEMQKKTTRTYFKIFDANGDGVGDGLDIMPMLQVASGLYGGEDMLFSIATDDKTEEKLIQLIDEEGNVANDIYVGFDYNRDGYITQDEGNAFKRVTLGYDY